MDLIENATLGGTPAFNDISTNNSTIEVDTAGTYTASTGKVLTTYGVAKSGALPVNQIIKDLEYFLQNGSSISLVTGGNSNNMTAILTWSEDF